MQVQAQWVGPATGEGTASQMLPVAAHPFRYDAEVAAASADAGADDPEHDVITYSFVAVRLLAQMLSQMIVGST